MSTAYMLAREGVDVAVLEAKSLGSGATGMTTAFLTHDIDTDLVDLVDLYGERGARLAWESHAAAIEQIESIAKVEKIECHFKRCPAYVYAFSEDELEGFEDEEAAARRLGFDVAYRRKNNLGFPNHGYLEDKNQAKFHPLEFLFGLAERAERYGARIFEKTEAVKISGNKALKIETGSGYKVSAKRVIVATYDPFNKPREVFAKKGMYVSYVIEARLPKGKFKEALYWDQYNPYYYFRIDRLENFDRIILGGADHREELPVSKAKSFKDLERYLQHIVGDTSYAITKKWTGPILEPSDGLALIGEYKSNQYLAAGFSGNGMTYSMISAMVFSDLIVGRKNEWAKIYDPKRPYKAGRYFKKGLDYAQELLGGAVKNTFKYKK